MLPCWFAGNDNKYCYISNTTPILPAVAEVGTDLLPALFKSSKTTIFNRRGHTRRSPCNASGLPYRPQW